MSACSGTRAGNGAVRCSNRATVQSETECLGVRVMKESDSIWQLATHFERLEAGLLLVGCPSCFSLYDGSSRSRLRFGFETQAVHPLALRFRRFGLCSISVRLSSNPFE